MDNYGPSGQSSRGRGQRGQRRGRSPFRGQWRPPRSFSNIGRDADAERNFQEQKTEELKQKDATYDEKKMEKTQPKKERPELDAPKISLDMDVVGWIEKKRANVEIKMYPNFEDEIITQHSKALDWSTTVLQYTSKDRVAEIKAHYNAYSVLNVAYRLLTTLPKSLKKQIADLLIQLQIDEAPRNTPLMAEMLSHIGKHKNEAYGNLRIEGQLLEARRRIVKAMGTVLGTSTGGELKFADGAKPDKINVQKDSIWNDSDSLGWLKRRVVDEYNEMRKRNYNISDIKKLSYKFGTEYETTNLYFSVPYIEFHLTDPVSGGAWYLSDKALSDWFLATEAFESDIQDRLMAIGMIMFMHLGFFRTSDTAFKKAYTQFSRNVDSSKYYLGKYADVTMNNLLDYLGFQSLSKILDDQDLLYNYGVIVDAYKTIAEPTIRQIFKLVPISNSEFGDEAQMMQVADAGLQMNPRVESNFKIRDSAKVGAAGIFAYTSQVRTEVADYTIMRRNKKAILSELMDKYCRKP